MNLKIIRSIFIKMMILVLTMLAGSGWLTGPAYADGQEFQAPCHPQFAGLFLAGAINQANSNPGEDKIILTRGCRYTLSSAFNEPDRRIGLPILNDDVIIEGNGATIARSNDPNTSKFRLLEASGSIHVTLENVSLINGHAAPSHGGGAISTGQGVILTLRNVLFFGNQADFGGAVAAQGPVFIQDSRFSSNKAVLQSGGAVFTTREVLVHNGVFSNNQAVSDGGGMYGAGTLNINKSTFINNSAGRSGGSLYGLSTVILIDNTFRQNHAPEGGSGLFLGQRQGGLSLLINNLWADNYKQSGQPKRSTLCLLCFSDSKGQVRVNHNTLANVVPLREKAIEVPRGEVQVTNSIITHYDTGIHNGAATVTTAHNLYFANFINEAGNIPPAQSHITGQDPLFVDPAKGRYTLQAGSPALGKADPAASELLDRRGVHRPQGSGPDIGADEFDEGFIPAGHVISLAACLQGEGDAGALIAAFEKANAVPGAHRIELGANCVYTLEQPAREFRGPTGLPPVTEYLVVAGNGATIRRSDSAGDFRIMAVDGALLDLRDLNLQNGHIEGDGAGLLVDNFGRLDEALTLTNVTFRGNTITNDSDGGGLYLGDTSTTIINRSRFEQNKTGEEGGGAYLYDVPDLRISDTQFSANTAKVGGGLVIEAVQGMIERSRFENNQALNEGGGLVIYAASTLKVTGSAFVTNSATGGGGIFAEERNQLTLDGNIFTRNEAPVGAGLLLEATSDDNLIANNLWVDNVTIDDEASVAITLRNDSIELEGQVDIVHNTIVSSTQAEGEGVWIGGPVVRLRNNIITNHNVGILVFETGAATAEHNLYAGNRFEEAGNIQSRNKLTTDQPIFVDPANGDFRLRSGSPAIDSGMDAGITVDHDGAARPFGPGFDIGAYEFGSTPSNPNPGGFSVFLPRVIK